MRDFVFEPAAWIPFRDTDVLERLRTMTPQELTQHSNEAFRVRISKNPGLFVFGHLFERIRDSDQKNERFVAILGNPAPGIYEPLAQLINYFGVSCRNFHAFTMDEWADENGNIAPMTYASGFTYSFFKYFINQIEPELRPPAQNIHYPTNENIRHYSDLICETGQGGADTIYSGPGWAGHVAFIDPCPEFVEGYREGHEYMIRDLSDPYFGLKSAIITVHPLTIVQNSLHGVFGQSGDLASVPPKAATIGPFDVANARERIETHSLTTAGSFSSWQRMTSRLITHGPVTPYVPGSMLQLMDTTVLLSETLAAPITCMETEGY